MKPPPIPNKFNRPPPPLKGPLAQAYKALPTLAIWRKDTGRKPASGLASNHIMRTIDSLIEALQRAEGGEYIYFMGRLFFTTMSWRHDHQYHPNRMRMDGDNRKPVLSLNLFAGNELARLLKCHLTDLASTLQNIYGVEMSPHGVVTDANEGGRYHTLAERERQRVFIFDGRAYLYNAYVKKFQVLYCSEEKPIRFVLSMGNVLYYAPENSTRAKYHSSFMSGMPVQCAGHFWADKGIITKIKNSSGHYKPVDTSLVKFLHFLQMYGIRMSSITVETVIFREAANGLIVAHESDTQSCRGDDFVKHNGNWMAIKKRAAHQSPIKEF